ncbi:unnamed protein product, partial [Ectocarpus sp. 4 AP-2014]
MVDWATARREPTRQTAIRQQWYKVTLAATRSGSRRTDIVVGCGRVYFIIPWGGNIVFCLHSGAGRGLFCFGRRLSHSLAQKRSRQKPRSLSKNKKIKKVV